MDYRTKFFQLSDNLNNDYRTGASLTLFNSKALIIENVNCSKSTKR
jgi:hypothetical protein